MPKKTETHTNKTPLLKPQKREVGQQLSTDYVVLRPVSSLEKAPEPLPTKLLPAIAAFAVDTRLGVGCIYHNDRKRTLGVDFRALKLLLQQSQLKVELEELETFAKSKSTSLDGAQVKLLKDYVHSQAFADWKKAHVEEIKFSSTKHFARNLSKRAEPVETGSWLQTRAYDDRWTKDTLPVILDLVGVPYDPSRRRHVSFGLEMTFQHMRSREEVDLHTQHFGTQVELLEFASRAGLPVPFPPAPDVLRGSAVGPDVLCAESSERRGSQSQRSLDAPSERRSDAEAVEGPQT